ncbi:MAG: (2Fe-2S)-binding protein [Gemmatimonadota bacterium]|nr:(2Fe-2S)-binding protein [Gemmatimonadota bacterium]
MENLKAALQYADFLKPGDAPSVREIMPGEGAVLRHGLHLVATYRDRVGELHERSAVCPHLKCIVHWNAMEKSWDCPCHGSRFDPYGEVLNGPAAAPLPEVQ